jgi:hypothetical protein
MPFIIIASLNRETIFIALLHGVIFNMTQPRNTHPARVARQLVWAAGTLLAIVGLRIAMNHLLGTSLSDNAAPMESPQTMRLLGNIDRILHNKHHTTQLLMLGAGVIVWLPFVFKQLPRQLQFIWLSSSIPFAMMMWAGNTTELRMYNEFIPSICVSMLVFLSGPPDQDPGRQLGV